MRSARALFASIGTSVMLVAAVTVSLLSVSAVFALGGFEDTGDASSGEALVLDLQGRSGPSSRSASRTVEAPRVAVVKRQPSPPPRRRAAASRPSIRSAPVRASTASATRASTAASTHVAALDERPTRQPPVVRQPSPPDVAKRPARNLGDGVKKLGDGLSSTVQQTGNTLAEVTAPLGEPVSQSVQQLMNVVAALVKGTTDGLGAALGAKP